MLPRFNRGPQCLRQGRLRHQGIHLRPRERVHRMVALHLVARPPHRSARYLPPWGVPTHRPLMTSPQMEVWWTPPPAGKEKGAAGAEEAKAERAPTALTLSGPPPLAEAEGRRRMGFLAKSRFQSLVGRVIQVRSLMPSGSGLGASPTIGTTMRTLTWCLWWSHLWLEMLRMYSIGSLALTRANLRI